MLTKLKISQESGSILESRKNTLADEGDVSCVAAARHYR